MRVRLVRVCAVAGLLILMRAAPASAAIPPSFSVSFGPVLAQGSSTTDLDMGRGVGARLDWPAVGGGWLIEATQAQFIPGAGDYRYLDFGLRPGETPPHLRIASLQAGLSRRFEARPLRPFVTGAIGVSRAVFPPYAFERDRRRAATLAPSFASQIGVEALIPVGITLSAAMGARWVAVDDLQQTFIPFMFSAGWTGEHEEPSLPERDHRTHLLLGLGTAVPLTPAELRDGFDPGAIFVLGIERELSRSTSLSLESQVFRNQSRPVRYPAFTIQGDADLLQSITLGLKLSAPLRFIRPYLRGAIGWGQSAPRAGNPAANGFAVAFAPRGKGALIGAAAGLEFPASRPAAVFADAGVLRLGMGGEAIVELPIRVGLVLK